MKSRKIGGGRIDFDLSYSDVLAAIDRLIATTGSHYLWTPNPEFVIDAQKDKDFKRLLNESAVSIADGAGLLFANKYLDWAEKTRAKILGNALGNNVVGKYIVFPAVSFIYGTWFGFSTPFINRNLGTRVTGADLIFKISEHAQEKGYSIFLLGGWEKDKWGRSMPTSGRVAEKAADVLKQKYPKLKVVGASSEFKRGPEDDKRTLEFIHGKMKEAGVDKVDIIFVCYNHIYQEKWLKRNIREIPAKVGLGTGGALDYVIGTQRRSPIGFIRKHLEWLYKLFTQPWRWKRIITAFPIFPLFVYYLSVKDDPNT